MTVDLEAIDRDLCSRDDISPERIRSLIMECIRLADALHDESQRLEEAEDGAAHERLTSRRLRDALANTVAALNGVAADAERATW